MCLAHTLYVIIIIFDIDTLSKIMKWPIVSRKLHDEKKWSSTSTAMNIIVIG